MVIMNDLEWPMISYYVIYYEKFNTNMLLNPTLLLAIHRPLFYKI